MMDPGHKSRQQRQKEARERKRRHLPVLEAEVRDHVAYLARNPSDEFAAQQVKSARESLRKAYLEAGYLENEAGGMARAVAAGRPAGTWLSGVD